MIYDTNMQIMVSQLNEKNLIYFNIKDEIKVKQSTILLSEFFYSKIPIADIQLTFGKYVCEELKY